jgi:hypothetical protein
LAAPLGGVSAVYIERGISAVPTAHAPARDDLQSRTKTIVDWTNVPSDAASTLIVACSPGSAALGGGVDVGSTAAMTIASAGPTINGSEMNNIADGTYGAPDGWHGGVYNHESSITRPFKVAPICAPLSNVSTVVSSSNVNPTAYWSLAVTCPAGKVAVGGGVDVEDVDLMVVTASSPMFGANRLTDVADGSRAAPDGWVGTVRNNAKELKTFSVGVVCQPLAGVSTVITSETVSAGSHATKRALCPTGQIAVGGGMA